MGGFSGCARGWMVGWFSTPTVHLLSFLESWTSLVLSVCFENDYISAHVSLILWHNGFN